MTTSSSNNKPVAAEQANNNKMKAALVSRFGQPNDVLTVGDIERPIADDKTLLIQVHSVSLSPGDYRNLLGDKTVIFNPDWPYIPGGDVCGTVLEVPTSFQNEFQVGDKVISTWSETAQNGLAEYMKVDPKLTIKMPSSLKEDEGAALANSASHALNVMNKKADIKEGDRVLVLGGSGGVGTILLQMLKQKKVSYIATTSTDDRMIKTLGGVDKVIDYTKEDWSQMDEYKQNKFDCIIDCAEGVKAWKKCSSVLKSCKDGGRFVALVLQDWHIDAKRVHQIIFNLLLPPLGRQLYNMFRRSTPYYRMYVDSATKDTLKEVMSMVEKNEIKAIIDDKSPYEFTTQGVRDAFNQHIDRKGHGKIIIAIDNNKDKDEQQVIET